jgi:mono/diheme cytochrome c family protein
MRVILFFSGVACLFLMALHAWRENLGAEWIPHQERYKAVLASRAGNDADQAVAAAYEVKLRQIVLAEGFATDRCVTCHVAVEDMSMKGESEPLRTHPGDYLNVHSMERFGCTLCHDGQGSAVNVADAAAYSRERYWEKPQLKAPFIEANCYRCHVDVLAQTPTYALGKQLFEGAGCTGCHTVRGRGGTVGPDLSNAGDLSRHLKVPTPEHHDLIERFNGNESLAYLYEAVRWPAAQPSNTKMPEFGFSDEEAIALVVYLKSFTRPATIVGLVPPSQSAAPPKDPVQRGRISYGRYCVGCHGVDAVGGVRNENSARGEVAPLNSLAASMGFASPEQAEALIRIFQNLDGAPLAESEARAFSNWSKIEATVEKTRRAIDQGMSVAAVDPRGPEPLDMPSWKHLIEPKEVDALIAYLLSAQPSGAPAAVPSGGR